MTEALRILLVDDDPEDRFLIQDALERERSEPLSITTAEDAEAGISTLQKQDFDVVLVDYHLPGMNGVQFLSRMRVDEVDVPVVVLTGQGSEEVAVEFMKAGAADYLTKRDLQAGRLRQTVKNVVQAHRNTRALERERRERQEELARLNEQLAFQKSLLENQMESAIDGILVVGSDGDIYNYNERFAEIWGLPRELLRERREEIALSRVSEQLVDPEKFMEKVRELYASPRDTSRDIIHLKDGRIIDRYSAPVTGPGDRYLARVWFFRDVTKDRRMVEELAQLNAELEEKGERLERKNRELDEFARVVSHDLREPLRTVKGFSHILEAEAGDALQPGAKEALNYIRDGVNRMENLITDLLRYARLSEEDGEERGTVDLDNVLGEALSNLGEAIAENGATVTRGDLPTIRGEPTQMVQLLQNLVGNAIKFKHPDRPLRVHVESARAEDGYAEVRVQDNGIGISPRHAERIFRVFQQLHPRGKYGGTGVGLAIAKKIVERHGGRIWVTGEEGQGATFHFTLPRADAPA